MIEINTTFFASIVNFVLLTALLTFFLYRPVRKFMAGRQERIRGTLEQASLSQADGAKMKQEYETRLAQARREAIDIVEKATVHGERVAAEILDKARMGAKALLEQAKTEARRDRAAAFEAMRDHIVDLVISIASRVTEKNVGSPDDESMILRLIEEGQLADEREREP